MSDNHPARESRALYVQLRRQIVAAAHQRAEQESRATLGCKRKRDRGSHDVEQCVLSQLASLASQALPCLHRTQKSDGIEGDQTVCGSLENQEPSVRGRVEKDVRLFNEQYVVKPPASRVEFGWHTDEAEQLQMCLGLGPGGPQSPPYLSIWLPLQRTDTRNGTMEVLPLSAAQPPLGATKHHPFFLRFPACARPTPSSLRAGERTEDQASSRRVEREDVEQDAVSGAGRASAEHGEHAVREETGGTEQRGAAEEEERECRDAESHGAVRVDAEAGTAVLFASHLWHRSGSNFASRPRRVFYAQYTSGVLQSDGTSTRACQAEEEEDGDAEKTRQGAREKRGLGARETVGPLAFAVRCEAPDSEVDARAEARGVPVPVTPRRNTTT